MTKEDAILRKQCDENIAQTIQLAQDMISLARKGYEQQEDASCGVLYGILLDTGYRILDLATKEKRAHIQKGWWDKVLKGQTTVEHGAASIEKTGT